MTLFAEPPAPAAMPATDRTPPNDANAERAVLGGMLTSPDAITEAVEILQTRDFYLPAHGRIFDVVCGMYNADEPADPTTVAARLAATGDLAKIGGAGYLATLMEAAPIVASTGWYARIVKDRADRRRLVEAGYAAVRMGFSTDGADADDLIDRAQQAMYDLTAQRASGDWSRLGALFEDTIAGVEAAGRGERPECISTGFIDLDRLLGGGLSPGQLVVVAGRPGQGKTTLAAGDFVRAAAIRDGHPAAVFSLEMSKPEIVLRLLSAEARVPLKALRSGDLSDDDWTKLARRMGEIEAAPLFIDDTPNMNLMEIRAKARRLKQVHGLKLLVIDYLGLMTPAKRAESRQNEVADMSRGLKLLAKEIGCPVVAVHQLNRGPEQRPDKRPALSDLRDSGAVEQDADIAILVHREDYYDKESPRAGEGDLIVAKHRNGETDTVTVAAQLHLSRFVDMAIGPEMTR